MRYICSMSKRFIRTLIVITTIVMACLIIVQFNSIQTAAKIKDEQFGHMVKRVLAKVVETLESQEMYEMILNEERASFLTPNTTYSGNPALNNYQPSGSNGGRSGNVSYRMQQQKDGTGYYSRFELSYTDTSFAQGSMLPRGRPGDFPSAFSKLYEYHNYLQEQYQNKLRDREILMRMVRSKALLSDKPIEQKYDPAFLENILRRELKNSDVEMDYRYAVISFRGGKSRFISGDADFDHEKNNMYSHLLFPHALITGSDYLYIYFPNQMGYLWKSTGFLVIPSIILTLLIIAIFVITINIILRQKKISNIKNDFINNMTHELKTPISTISLASQMLHDSSVSNTPKTIEHVSNVIFQESKRLSFQVEKVLQMAVFNEGRLKLKFKEFNLNDLLKTVVQNSELKVQNKNGELFSKLKAKKTLIKGDEVHITNVMFNLIDNAVKYSLTEPQITITTENKKGFVIVSVKDNGIGIAKEHQKQIFERFYRVPTGNVHNVKGFGLGLSYVKKIIDVHQGHIMVDSALGKGTRFSLFFPLNHK